VHPGQAQLRCIARNARRCGLVANRRVRPASNATPSPPSTTGKMSASHHSFRTVATGNGTPLEVSHTPPIRSTPAVNDS